MSAEDNLDQIDAASAATGVQTVEKDAEYASALEHEKQGYTARLKALEDGKQDPLSAGRLNELVAGVDAELARLGQPSAKTPRKSRRKAS